MQADVVMCRRIGHPAAAELSVEVGASVGLNGGVALSLSALFLPHDGLKHLSINLDFDDFIRRISPVAEHGIAWFRQNCKTEGQNAPRTYGEKDCEVAFVLQSRIDLVSTPCCGPKGNLPSIALRR